MLKYFRQKVHPVRLIHPVRLTILGEFSPPVRLLFPVLLIDTTEYFWGCFFSTFHLGTLNCVCQGKSVIFRVLGMYNFDFTLIYKPKDAKKKHQGGIRPRSIIQRVFDLRNKGTLINHSASVVKKLRILKIRLTLMVQLWFQIF